ncbi:MAG TPA: BON domain-containing protein [Actinomycetota bacterium]|nr:BON domain-containing protein [Actinomycetota bacterium]
MTAAVVGGALLSPATAGVLTGGPLLRRGLRQLAIGVAAAAVTYGLAAPSGRCRLTPRPPVAVSGPFRRESVITPMLGNRDLAEHERGNERARPGHDRAARQTPKGPRRMTDDELQDWVREELCWDPKVDSAAIAVSASDGEVTLRGTVASFREKREAQRAAERVYGVTSVRNQLEVRIVDEHGRQDADLRGAVLQAMALDGLIPKTVDAKADRGLVTLTGAAAWQYQREEAEFVVGNVPGVVDVDNQITLTTPQPKAGDVKQAIERAFQRNANLDAEGLSVGTRGNLVTLGGAVSSWDERDAAVTAAWAAPGVAAVEDRIVVEY